MDAKREREERRGEFGDLLRSLRERTGLTRGEVLSELKNLGFKISYSTYAKWEEGINRPRDYHSVKKLCDALGLEKMSEERRLLFWLAGEWIEKIEPLDGLPGPRCHKLYGRTEQIDEVIGTLENPRSPQIVMIAQGPGYGKTEFARYIAEQSIKFGIFVDCAWLSFKREEFEFTLGKIRLLEASLEPSLQSMERRLMYRLSCRGRSELKSRLRSEPILIVVDNLESLPVEDRERAVNLVHDLIGGGKSRAIFTSRFDVTVPYVYKPPFGGLSSPATMNLLREEAARFYPRAQQLRSASEEELMEIWKLTNGMALALHMVVAQAQHYELDRVIKNLKEARASGPDEDFYTFLYYQAWREISKKARALLVYMGTATQAPQTSLQLLGISPAAGFTFDEVTLHEALAELSRWFLIERVKPIGVSYIAYDLHSLTRSFLLNPEIREKWEKKIKVEEMFREATRKHKEILEKGIGEASQDTPGY